VTVKLYYEPCEVDPSWLDIRVEDPELELETSLVACIPDSPEVRIMVANLNAFLAELA